MNRTEYSCTKSICICIQLLANLLPVGVMVLPSLTLIYFRYKPRKESREGKCCVCNIMCETQIFTFPIDTCDIVGYTAMVAKSILPM